MAHKTDEEILNVFETECKHDEGLNQEEAGDALTYLYHNPTKLDISDFWDKHVEGRERINGEEFIQLYKSLGDPIPKLWDAFKKFDVDNSNTIDRDELKAIVAHLDIFNEGVADDDYYMEQTFSRADKNGDNSLDIKGKKNISYGEHSGYS
ncbi:hypothetical protein ACF0H5_002920 [Mactra antiquata]